jgi:hypothetical protein
MAQNEFAERLEEVEQDAGVTIEVTGGGKGWTARTVSGLGGEQTFKATSKMAALEGLADLLDTEDEEAEPGEEIEGCSDECQSSTSNICQCACQGENHGVGVNLSKPIVVVGDKPCKCGCGMTTKRTFVPGHDARYHGLMGLMEWWDGQDSDKPFNEAEARKAKASALRKAARERRAAQRAEVAARVMEVVKTIPVGPKPGKSGSPKGDALLF